METTIEPSMQVKPFSPGRNIEFKELDDKILISATSPTHFKEGNFTLDAHTIHIQAGPGVKISSRGNNTLVISADLNHIEEDVFDFKKSVDERLKVIEKSFALILKQVQVKKWPFIGHGMN